MRKYHFTLLSFLLIAHCLIEAKRYSSSNTRIGGGNSRSYSAPSHTYRAQTAPPSSYSRSSYTPSNSQPKINTNYGWNVNTKPVVQPSANNPTYSGNIRNSGSNVFRTQTQRPVISNTQRSSIHSNPIQAVTRRPVHVMTQRPMQTTYPKQQIPLQSQIPANAKYYPSNQIPAGAKIYPQNTRPVSAVYHPAPQGSTFLPVGHVPVGATYYPAGSFPSGYHPVQTFPVTAIQPGYYPAGTFPRQSSGPGFGTGLIAGAIGGAILANGLPHHHGHHYHHNHYNDNNINRETVIKETTIINNNVQPSQNNAPATQHSDPTVPLASVPQSQSALSSTPFQQGNSYQGRQGYQNEAVPLAPFADGANRNQSQMVSDQYASGGVYCSPVLVNITSDSDPKNITQIEQVACYEIPVQQQQSSQTSEQSQLSSPSTQTRFQSQPYSKSGLIRDPNNELIQSTSTISKSTYIRISGADRNEISFITIFSSITLAYILLV